MTGTPRLTWATDAGAIDQGGKERYLMLADGGCAGSTCVRRIRPRRSSAGGRPGGFSPGEWLVRHRQVHNE